MSVWLWLGVIALCVFLGPIGILVGLVLLVGYGQSLERQVDAKAAAIAAPAMQMIEQRGNRIQARAYDLEVIRQAAKTDKPMTGEEFSFVPLASVGSGGEASTGPTEPAGEEGGPALADPTDPSEKKGPV